MTDIVFDELTRFEQGDCSGLYHADGPATDGVSEERLLPIHGGQHWY